MRLLLAVNPAEPDRLHNTVSPGHGRTARTGFENLPKVRCCCGDARPANHPALVRLETPLMCVISQPCLRVAAKLLFLEEARLPSELGAPTNTSGAEVHFSSVKNATRVSVRSYPSSEQKAVHTRPSAKLNQHPGRSAPGTGLTLAVLPHCWDEPTFTPTSALLQSDPACVKTRTPELSTNYLYNIKPVRRKFPGIVGPTRQKIAPTTGPSAF